MSNVTDRVQYPPAPINRSVDVETFIHQVVAPPLPPQSSWHPMFVVLDAGQYERFASFCGAHHITLIDTIERQLLELAAVRLPSTQQSTERGRFIAELVERYGGRAAVGNWVYLPWEQKVVHLLGEEEYLEVITNRNLDKINPSERQLLRTKQIGVMGLSVGGEAAVAVAQEHLCGEIALADFDRLDLSNLNRLSAGFDELGLPKTTIAARRIARIDPYLTVRVFEDGVTEANLEQFLEGLDLLIEECDDLRIKHRVRTLAKERRLNIVFAGDERGFISIEPHAHQADLPIFHGRIPEPQPPREAFPTPAAFLRELTEWLGGWTQISGRSRHSLEKVGETLCGYPQLASEARYAAGQIGHVARRLLLGEQLPPFIGNLDLTELIPSAPRSNGEEP